MTKPVLADPHRAGKPVSGGFASSEGGEGASLELPVLFQLSDLSQFKVLRPVAAPGSERKPPGQILKAAAKEAPSPQRATDRPSPSAASAVLTGAAGVDLTGQATADLLVSSPEVPLPADDASLPPGGEKTAPLADSPTIRERARMRERRRQAATTGDWFQTQGKYIVVVFLILLAGTIYVARNGDDTPPPPATDPSLLVEIEQEGTSAPPADAENDDERALAATPNGATRIEQEPAVTATSPAADSLAETSPAEADSSPVASPDAPAVPQAADEPAPQVSLQAPISTAPPAAADSREEGLFPWNGQQDSEPAAARVASRPPAHAPPSSPHLPSPNPHYQGRPENAGTPRTASQPPTAGGIPAGSATGSAPEGQGAPTVYPVADPINYPVADPATESRYPPPRGPADASAVPASYENRVPPATPSGPRHERTGSGLY